MTTVFSQKNKENEHFFDKPLKIEHPDTEYAKEYLYVTLLGIIFFFLVSVITYNPTDPTTFNINSLDQTNSYPVTNTFGRLGASIADWCFQIFGIGSILFSFVFFIQVLSLFRKPATQRHLILRIFGYPQLIACYLALLSAITQKFHFRGIDILTGGFLGNSLFSIAKLAIGDKGAILVFSLGSLSSITLCLGIRPISTIYWIFNLLPFRQFRDLAQAVEESEKLLNEEQIQQKSEKIIVEKKYRITNAEHFNSLVNLLNQKRTATEKIAAHENQKLMAQAQLIEEKLSLFGVKGTVAHSQNGPVINVHEFEPAPGVKINKIFSLQDELMLALKAHSVLISLQPGKSTLAIEVPADNRELVSLREVMESDAFQDQNIPLPVALGKNVDGSLLIADLSSMPHLLVAGSTGSGKSVCINNMLLSLMISKTPSQLRMILVDPKMLELSHYNGIGHLLIPVVTDPAKAASALKWAIAEMEHRYLLMNEYHARNISGFNEIVESGQLEFMEHDLEKVESLPYIVIIIDELCDLMMTAAKEVEDSIQRLAQKARAAGIHLILATQRPSVDVLTGVIKANLPCRLSFQVASKHDSRTIIEDMGAERLLGKGDMLFLQPGSNKTQRAQCAFVTDKEINEVSEKLRSLYPSSYENGIIKLVERTDCDSGQNDNTENEILLRFS